MQSTLFGKRWERYWLWASVTAYATHLPVVIDIMYYRSFEPLKSKKHKPKMNLGISFPSTLITTPGYHHSRESRFEGLIKEFHLVKILL